MDPHDTVPVTPFEKAIDMIQTATPPPDPLAPSCHPYRLRPSEEAAILLQLKLNPPPPWGIKINLSRSFIGPEKCVALGRKIMLNSTLTYLDLSMNNMGEEGAVRFFECISRNKTLKHLSVNGNLICDRGAIAAAVCLLHLESFHSASNEVTDLGAAALADALRMSSTLKTLSVRNNRITVAGVEKFLSALENHEDKMSRRLSATAVADTADVPQENSTTVLQTTSHSSQNNDRLPSGNTGEENSASPKASDEAPLFVGIPGDTKVNHSLHTLWIDQNVNIPEVVFERLAQILATRVPAPPEAKKKGKRGKK